jgi:cysteine desulfurase family protein
MIYLDAAATTLQKPKGVSSAVGKAVKTLTSPGRGQYYNSMLSSKIAYECREKAAHLFNVPYPDNVVFTFNATHGLNMAIASLVGKGDRVVVSGYEHNAVMRPLKHIGADTVIAECELFDAEGALREFDRLITPDTKAVVCTHVSNVFGFVLPVEEIGKICRERGVPFIIDASQSAGALHVNFAELNAEFIAMPGHKGLYGPQGTGLLLCRKSVSPLLKGGTGSSSKLSYMPDYLPDAGEAGTHNMPGISGLSAGLDFVMSTGTERILRHEKELIGYLIPRLSSIEGLRVFAPGDRSLQAGVLSFLPEHMDCEYYADLLSQYGIAVRAGFHCSPYAHNSAGTYDTGTVRVSVSAFNTKDEMAQFIKICKRITVY